MMQIDSPVSLENVESKWLPEVMGELEFTPLSNRDPLSLHSRRRRPDFCFAKTSLVGPLEELTNSFLSSPSLRTLPRSEDRPSR